ncbi:AlpA family phage regulatory protein [Pigmentiphaga sp. GD03639]|jgi:prophage regulatory protein|uniref:helix-turn-helix transcriptional regulator n=1 Tax=unclassified Pigmentiphaga TaxID=2626614 RepID=UPI00244CAD83|nr:AlpA family phage regulatory protein [Pigmentiphaga sp. GD03639]MDH2239515.1 AlpA family phage regulatory protein [Pigmentiphaga sp. GD03639]
MHAFDNFPRLKQALQIIPMSRATWYAGVRPGRYPAPAVKLGARISAWRANDIQLLASSLQRLSCVSVFAQPSGTVLTPEIEFGALIEHVSCDRKRQPLYMV